MQRKSFLFGLPILLSLVPTVSIAHDDGKFDNVPPKVRQWFHDIISPGGVPCCDIADGRRTDFDMRKDLYWVPVNGTWIPVPPDKVIKNAHNPTGAAVIWYSEYGGQVVIRCFVPGSGA